IGLMVVAMLVFAVQDAISLHLTTSYNVYVVVMIRYWFFAAFVMTVSAKQAGGLRNAAATQQPFLQFGRGLLLALEICVMMTAFTFLGLVESLALFTCYPLLVAALSGPILGEAVGWRRWGAIAIGFVGVLFIIKPGIGVFSPYAAIPLISALMFALYSLLTRYAARKDTTATSFFWTGAIGVVVMTSIGIFHWEVMQGRDYIWMAALCVSGATGHWMLIRIYELAEASVVQPFAYLHFAFAAVIGVLVFHEVVEPHVILGVAIVVFAGLFTLWRERQKTRQDEPTA
ncbi:MAG: DMT family transporter, partial [Planktomarina sp.]